MTEPTERQVLYALVAAGFMLVVAVLGVFAALSGLSPRWWSVVMGAVWLLSAVYAGRHWRSTGTVVPLSISVFAIWAIGTLITR